jgi:hypothetical protein
MTKKTIAKKEKIDPVMDSPGAEYHSRYGKHDEKWTGTEVGLAFLQEFIKVYKGSLADIIPDEERAKMVASLDNLEDMAIYQKYRDIYWHFIVITSQYEQYCTEARYWYLKLKSAIADGDQMKNDETDDFLNTSPTGEVPKTNHEKIQMVLAHYIRCLYLCHGTETGMEIITNSIGIDDSPFRGTELHNTYLKDANKLIRAHKELKLKPVRKKDLELSQANLDNIAYLAASILDNPDVMSHIFTDAFDI